MNILLMGMRGCGKSSVGTLLATRIRRTFVDLDTITATRCNAPTAGQALALVGEVAFRAAEMDALRVALQSSRFVLALGGGTPTASGAADVINAQRASAKCLVVYLRATVSTLRERLEKTDLKSRPSLTGKGVLQEIPEILQQREPVYTSLADITTEVDGRSVEEVVKAIAGELKQRGVS